MQLGRLYLGFLIPMSITMRLFTRDSTPTRGICGDCGVEQELTYALGDYTRECRECIKFLVTSQWIGEVREQAHPPHHPREGIVSDPEPIPAVFEEAFA